MTSHRFFLASLLALPLLAAALPAAAQDYDRPAPGYGSDDRSAGPESGPGDSQDAAGMGVRIGRLESRIREMTGQIEELQNANRKLVQQLQKFQQDVDSRLSSGGSRPKRAEAEPAAPPSPDTPAADSPKPTRKARRDDAYDPETAANGNPGQPKPLGSPASGQPDDNGSAPMDLSGGRLRRGSGGTGGDDAQAPTLKLPSTPKSAGSTPPDGPVVAAVNPTSPRAAFDQALSFYKGKQYEDAEKGFVAFIQKNPKSRLAADATYYLGESFAQRGRSREAAEQYLKVSTDYANSTRAPDAMLHLGISLRALGAKEQACATFTEVSRKYPNAPAYVKSGVERESKRSQC